MLVSKSKFLEERHIENECQQIYCSVYVSIRTFTNKIRVRNDDYFFNFENKNYDKISYLIFQQEL